MKIRKKSKFYFVILIFSGRYRVNRGQCSKCARASTGETCEKWNFNFSPRILHNSALKPTESCSACSVHPRTVFKSISEISEKKNDGCIVKNLEFWGSHQKPLWFKFSLEFFDRHVACKTSHFSNFPKFINFFIQNDKISFHPESFIKCV